MSKVKDVYSRIAPASKLQINVKNGILENLLKDVKKKLEKQQKEDASFRKVSADNDKKLKVQLQKLEKQQRELQEQNKQLLAEQKKQNEVIENILGSIGKSGELLKVLKQIQDLQKKNRIYIEKSAKAADEAVYGLIFNNAISGSSWLLNKKFYPGRWAVGYQYLYVLFRVLNEYKPKRILELGLGQSTHMITQYVEAYEGIQHRVVEHDEMWIDFFLKEHMLSKNSEIVQLNLGKEEYLEDPEVLSYQNFCENLNDRKYDFISVDAPFGGYAKIYSRIDILKIIPECLEDSFVIMVDDANRKGEQQTIQLVKEKLEENNIEFLSGYYEGNKETYIIVSADNKFLCSL